MRHIAVTAHREAAVVEVPDLAGPLAADQVRGPTLISLVSPGTELNYAFLAKDGFPHYVGYASIFRVEEVGSGVTDIPIGSLALTTFGGHREFQDAERKNIVPLPEGLAPEKAVFARLAGVSMSTLNTTAVRPPSRVLVTGLGPVGNLAAQMFAACGYQVTAVDPSKSRCESARKIGLEDIRTSLADGPVDLTDKVMLHVECSGHEKAASDGVATIRKGGEVVLVGVPWQRKTEIYAFDFLRSIFLRYATVRSGWEWEVPTQPTDFSGSSLVENWAAALRWIASGKLNVDGMTTSFAPEEVQKVYLGLLDQSLPTLSAIFDWRKR